MFYNHQEIEKWQKFWEEPTKLQTGSNRSDLIDPIWIYPDYPDPDHGAEK